MRTKEQKTSTKPIDKEATTTPTTLQMRHYTPTSKMEAEMKTIDNNTIH